MAEKITQVSAISSGKKDLKLIVRVPHIRVPIKMVRLKCEPEEGK